jgi:O-antigen/teichoic acid export membrane protein
MLEEGTPDPAGQQAGLRQRAATNTATLMAGTVVSRLAALVAVGYLARRFEAEGLGAYNLTIAFTAVFALLADLGMSIYVTRETAARPDEARDILRRGALGSFGCGIAAFALCNAIAWVAGYDDELRRWILIASVATLLGPAVLPQALLQARLQGGQVAALMLAAQAMAIGAVAFVIATERGIETYIVLQALINLVYAGLVVAVARAPRYYRGRFTPEELRAGLRMVVRAAPLGAVAVIALVHTRLDTFILSVISGERSVGFYSSAWKLSELLHFVPGAVGASVAPIVARQIDLRRDTVVQGLRIAFRYLALLGIPLLVGALVLAEPLLELVYGPGFEPAADPYRVLMLGEVSYFFGGVAAATLVGMRGVRELIVIQAVTLPGNALACLIFLPRYDYQAAAWITLGAELVTTGYLVAVVSRRLEVGAGLLPFGAAAQAILASLPMAGAVLLLDELSVLARVAVGAVVYGVGLVTMRAVGRDELEIVRGVFSRRRP